MVISSIIKKLQPEAMEYDVPGQFLSTGFHKLITDAKTGFVISDVRQEWSSEA